MKRERKEQHQNGSIKIKIDILRALRIGFGRCIEGLEALEWRAFAALGEEISKRFMLVVENLLKRHAGEREEWLEKEDMLEAPVASAPTTTVTARGSDDRMDSTDKTGQNVHQQCEGTTEG